MQGWSPTRAAGMFLGFSKARVLLFSLCITAMSLCLRSSWNVSLYGSRESSSCSCDKCLTEGVSWFRALIRDSPQPFLSRMNKTSEDVFIWWKRLQSEHDNFTYFNTTVDKLLKVLPPTPDIVESRPDRCRTCAVVGNSRNLIGSRYGPVIDVHDIVIRINHGRTKGYESDVGTKTTHHVMYPESAVPLDNTTHLVLFPFKIKDLLWLLKMFDAGKNNDVERKMTASKDLVMILSPAFMKYVHRKWLANNGKYPSTGFLTLALSMQLCDEVSVFGFGADSDGNWSHYFEKLRNKNVRTGPHAGSLENQVILLLQRMQKITLYRGMN